MLREAPRYLSELLERYNFDVIKALAAYNAGPQRVQQYGGVPPYYETRTYVARIVRDYNRKKIARAKAAAAAAKAGRNKPAASKPAAVKAGFCRRCFVPVFTLNCCPFSNTDSTPWDTR